MVFNTHIVSTPVTVMIELLLIFLSRRQLLASVLFSLTIVPALAQTDIVCNNTGITKDCTQFITQFCADIASVKVSSSLLPRSVHITHLVFLMAGRGV